MFLVSSCSCLCPIHWSQVLSWEWRCNWSSADRRCSYYIWVFNNLLPTMVRLILEVLRYLLNLKFFGKVLARRCAMAWSLIPWSTSRHSHQVPKFLWTLLDLKLWADLLHLKFHGKDLDRICEMVWPFANRALSGIYMEHPNHCVCCDYTATWPNCPISSSIPSSCTVDDKILTHTTFFMYISFHLANGVFLMIWIHQPKAQAGDMTRWSTSRGCISKPLPFQG